MVGSEIRMGFETKCIMALQGHPRSLILAPHESAYATSYWSSIVTSVVSCPVSDIDVINVYNVYKKFFVNAFIILSTFISIKIT